MGSTNHQIENYIKKHYKGRFMGCFYADCLPRLLPPNASLIANYSNQGEEGTHWVAIGNLNQDNGKPSFYMDSFGKKPDGADSILNKKTDFLEYIKRNSRNRFSNNKENLQAPTSDTCGEYATYAIVNQCVPYMNQPDPWKPFLNEFTTPEKNDVLIRQLIQFNK